MPDIREVKYTMSDITTVAILSKVRDCRLKADCDFKCQDCPHDHTNEEFTQAISNAIQACLERGRE